ncbi:helix-turn-helix domain-containing protein [Colwellia sp. E150_009]
MAESTTLTEIDDEHIFSFSPEELFSRCHQNLDAASIVSVYDLLSPNQEDWIEGNYNFWYFNDEFAVGLRDLKIKQDLTTISPLKKTLSLEYLLIGGSDMQLGQKSINANGMPKIYISSHCNNGQQTRFYKKGEYIKSIGFWITPDYLKQTFDLDMEQLPLNFKSMLNLEQDITAIIPMTSQIKVIVSEMLSPPFTGALLNQYLQAKMTELLCHTILSMFSPELTFQENNQLSRQKSNVMKKLLQILEEQSSSPPCLEQLAKQLAISRSSMTSTFKASYGMTISDYVFQKRMNKAQQLLKTGKYTVLEVALEIGYDDQSSFGRAYKRFFNYPPNEERPK